MGERVSQRVPFGMFGLGVKEGKVNGMVDVRAPLSCWSWAWQVGYFERVLSVVG